MNKALRQTFCKSQCSQSAARWPNLLMWWGPDSCFSWIHMCNDPVLQQLGFCGSRLFYFLGAQTYIFLPALREDTDTLKAGPEPSAFFALFSMQEKTPAASPCSVLGRSQQMLGVRSTSDLNSGHFRKPLNLSFQELQPQYPSQPMSFHRLN